MLLLAMCLSVLAGQDSAGGTAAGDSGTAAATDTGAPPDTVTTVIDTLVPADAPWLAEMDDSSAVAARGIVPERGRGQRPGRGTAGAGARMVRALAASAPVRWLGRHALRLLLAAASIAVIWSAFGYLGARREQERFLTTTRLSIMDKEVQRACRLVESGYADPGLTPESLCAQLVTGESFLEALYQRELGMSVAEFIEQVRVNRARQLLRLNPLVPVSELAAATGFGGADDLSRVFERIAGTTVERYREALRAGEEPAA